MAFPGCSVDPFQIGPLKVSVLQDCKFEGIQLKVIHILRFAVNKNI